ncbi:hypothetical protein VMT65_38060 [Nocardia sp. CDC153]|uniref:hypothetical protein n=1 Tax=Nocardia sp. CDC153 TaxID=3112167 RepID=UPI002DB7AE0F|nr:hypothetical protein [Nocardia sp. CDC153]MEC3958891.1 hypothetical protein [Nocardia sp. CDC153]
MGGIVFNQFDRVEITTDDFEDLGVPRGAVCFILDLYTSDEFELDYQEEGTGATILTFSARSDQIRRLDK